MTLLNKNFKRVFAALLMMLLCLTFVADVRADDSVGKAESAVVAVAEYGYYEVYDADKNLLGSGEDILASGSGFFVGATEEKPEYLVTNNHVIADYLESQSAGYVTLVDERAKGGYLIVARIDQVRVYYTEKDYDVAIIVAHGDSEITTEARKDLAVLKIGKPTTKRNALPIRKPTEDMKGDKIYCVGFPGQSDNQYFSSGSKWSMSDVSATSGTLVKITSTSQVKIVEIDAVIKHGNSGGPIIDEYGNVIGVSTWFYDTGENSSANYYGVSAEEVMSMLDANKIPYMKGKAVKQSNSSFIVIIAIVAGVVVFLVIVILVLAKKRGSAPEDNTPKGIVRSNSPQHNGQLFKITKAPILVGRDSASCTITYMEGTPGVSGRHCSIGYEAATGEFIVTDLGSSYGTFLTNGQKLTANIPYKVKAGQTICIGDKANILSLENGK